MHTKIILDTAGTYWRVTEPTDPALAHAYLGRRVRKLGNAFPFVKAARWQKEILVRKAHTVVIREEF